MKPSAPKPALVPACDKLHQFDPAVAETHGLNAAVLYQYLSWHCRKFGKWVGRKSTFLEMCPYMTPKELRLTLPRLLGHGYPKLLNRRVEGSDRYLYTLAKRVRGGVYYFDPRMATQYGILAAVVYDNVVFWLSEALMKDNGVEPTHYLTPKEALTIHPYATLRSLERVFQLLRDEGELVVAGRRGRATVWTIPLGIGKLDRWQDLHRRVKEEVVNNFEESDRINEAVLDIS